ncbi:MAG: regulatory protein RecX, partial [Clostridia bacterium]|nr:regulatory protein RecX [Clostridia bacterium]
MRITSAETAKGKDMVRIYIDGEYAFSIPQEDYIRNHLYEEMELTAPQLEEIKRSVLVHSARQKAVVYLTIKDRSEKELIDKLVEAGFDVAVAQAATE